MMMTMENILKIFLRHGADNHFLEPTEDLGIVGFGGFHDYEAEWTCLKRLQQHEKLEFKRV